MTSCAACHGDHLAGTSAPALIGTTFDASWAKHTASELYEFVQSTMPAGAGGALSSQAYVNVVAFILRENGAQPGPDALSPQTKVKIGDIIIGAKASTPAGLN